MADARHRSARSRRPGAILRFGVPLLVVLLVAGGGYAARGMVLNRGEGGNCPETLTLSVRTAPSLTAPLTDLATGYNASYRQVDRQCVRVRIETVGSGETAAALGAGWSQDKDGAAPDVWIPESTSWVALARTGAAARTMVPSDGKVIATSPLVLAMPRPMAAALGWPGRQLSWADLRANEDSTTFWSDRGHAEWGSFKVGFANPDNAASGISAVANVVAAAVGSPVSGLTDQMFASDLNTKGAVLAFERHAELVADSDADLLTAYTAAGAGAPSRFSALVVPESDVYQANRGIGGAKDAVPLAASYPTDGPVVDDVPFVTLGSAAGDPDRAAAAADFLAAAAGPAGRAALAAAGFRTPDRQNPSLTEQLGLRPTLRDEPLVTTNGRLVAAIRGTFDVIHRWGSTLAVFDTSGSMADPVPRSGGKSKLAVAVAASNTAVTLFSPQSRLGLWQFSTRLDGDKDYRQLVPVGPMNVPYNGVPREQALDDALATMRPKGSTGLYDTTLAAFRMMSGIYLPDRPNEIVLLTDGKNDDSGSIDLPGLITALKAEYDPKRPVHIITIAYGADADPDALRQISAATGAKSYPAQDPNSIFQVMVNALTER
jgi:Ca-activated chloride channel family protein